jgi:hypothetical protein
VSALCATTRRGVEMRREIVKRGSEGTKRGREKERRSGERRDESIGLV